MIKFVAALVFVGLNFYTFYFLASEDYIPQRELFSDFPMELDGWHCNAIEAMDDEILGRLGVTDYLLCNFVNRSDRDRANVYIGYHQTQTRTSEGGETIIHPPEHCLPGSGWDIIDTQIVPIDYGVLGEAKRVIIAKGNRRNLVYFWYQSRGRVVARNHEKILYMFFDRATERRTDGSLVRFTIPIKHGDEEEAEAIFRSLAGAVTPLLPRFVPN